MNTTVVARGGNKRLPLVYFVPRRRQCVWYEILRGNQRRVDLTHTQVRGAVSNSRTPAESVVKLTWIFIRTWQIMIGRGIHVTSSLNS